MRVLDSSSPSSTAPPPLVSVQGTPRWAGNSPPGKRPTALLILLGCLVAGGIARLAIDGNWPLPRCAFHLATGLPCFTCGSTRALAALGRLDLRAALALNPLVTLLVLSAPMWPSLAAGRSRQRRFFGGRFPIGWKLGVCLLAAAVGANWIYLLRTLPR